MDHVQSMKGHFTAEDLVFSLGRQRKRVSRATVYRTLELLLDRGVLWRVHVGERGAVYEFAGGRAPHAHLYCLGCGRLSDYPLARLDRLPEQVWKEAQFQTDHLSLRICGYCQSCRRRTAKKPPSLKAGRKGKSRN
jgi:Fur family transcriptional regulator, ferric uptake regulator